MNKELLDYFNGDELAASVWETKYAQDGEITPKDMHLRMAKEFFRIDKNYQGKEPIPDKWNDKWRNLSDYGKERNPLTEETIFNFFDKFKYIVPQGSVMATLGTNRVSSLSNCFVGTKMRDSYSSILKADAEFIYLFKRRGGNGNDISPLRPKGATTHNSSNTSTGAVSFLERFSNSTRECSMNGRRGATMLSMSVNHPDILDFIRIKRDLTKVTGANLSVQVTDEFMKAVEKDEDFILRFPVDITKKEIENVILGDLVYEPLSYNKLHKIRNTFIADNKHIYVKKVKAKDIWKEIIIGAKDYAEPGTMYIDNVHKYDPASVYPEYKSLTSNPCGEQYLDELNSCRLMLINLFSFVDNPFTDKAKIDYKKLYEIAYEHTRLGDNMIDLEAKYVQRIIDKIKSDPEPDEIKRDELELWVKVKEKAIASRRIGLGITGLGDMLAALGLSYGGDKESLGVIKKIMKIKMKAELDCSIDLAILRGTFDGYDTDKEYPIVEGKTSEAYGEHSWSKTIPFYSCLYDIFPKQVNRMIKYGRRNVSWSTISPAGSVSILTGTSSGLEPLFKPFYTRRKKVSKDSDRVDFVDKVGDKWQEYSVLHPKFKEWLLTRLDMGITKEEKLQMISNLKENTLLVWFKLSPWYNNTAEELLWENRIDVLEILQLFSTNALSNTINLPEGTTFETVEHIYKEAYNRNLKGVTVYVSGSRDGVLVDKKSTELVTFNETHAPKRPKKLDAKVFLFNNNYEKWVAFIGLLDGKPYELFTGLLSNVNLPSNVEYGQIVKVRLEDGKKRFDFEYEGGIVEGISKVTSKDIYNYGRMLSGLLRHGMGLPYVVNTMQNLEWEEEHINTWKNGVIRVLRKFIKEGTTSLKCPECGADMKYTEGCMSCSANCGYSKCG